MTTFVVDANVGALTVLKGALSDRITDLWEQWLEAGEDIVAPSLWMYEVTSLIRKAWFHQLIDAQQAESAMDALFDLGVRFELLSPSICRAALGWSERLGHSVAYDGAYLALAEALGVPLWTADRRLARRAHELGAGWVRFIGDSTQRTSAS